MNGLEKLALLKMDFLGLTTLDAHRRRAEADREAPRREARASKTCRSTIRRPTRSSRKGFTSGVFQFESPRHARHSAPLPAHAASKTLTALNALYRPGPIQGGMIDDFIERKHGRKASDLRSSRS